jgi:hypothetical protein
MISTAGQPYKTIIYHGIYRENHEMPRFYYLSINASN